MVDPFSPKHNVIGECSLILRPLISSDFIPLTFLLCCSFFHSVGRNGSGKSNFFYGMLCVYSSQTSVVMFSFSELMNGLYSLF